MSQKILDKDLLVYKAISNFVSDLCEVFGSSQYPLKFYNRLLQKTTLSHTVQINKHISIFQTFCVNNRENILASNKNLTGKIAYSERVFIDLGEILSKSDKQTTGVIFKHLLTISAMVDPVSSAKKVLKELNKEGEGNEEKFLMGLMDQIGTLTKGNEEVNTNPMGAITSMMSSGVFTDIMTNMQSGMQNGNLDLGKLMGCVEGMIGGLSSEIGDNPEMAGMMNMMSNLTSKLPKSK